ncbi:cytochrome P450 monooxygenase-like protein [Plenodomus tracheiphilus IPT5]|uniref:Cytochrome P450 monooxygenase-like protein n=1 Tax=Plenodomus tracheiphilus IPT5 TaxID=1408161 RepID=A0A6A7B6W4_9PLEO|nr:cytochrome P450 monooxygenase-like protein [Plenodomus tracheiphilus IPT5]
MELQTYAGLSLTLQTVAITVLVFALCTYSPKLKVNSQLAKLPSLRGSILNGENQRQAYLTSSRNMYNEGYQKFKKEVYRIVADSGETHVVVPPPLLPELRKLSDDVLSMPKAVNASMVTKYTKISTGSEMSLHSIKADLTPSLPRLNPTICEEVDASLREYMPPCPDWTELKINKILVDIITKVSGRIFVGPDLSENPAYLEAASNYTMDLMKAVNVIKRMRPWLRPLLAHRTNEVRQLREREAQAQNYFKPLIAERVHAKKTDPNWQAPDDMLQWMMNRTTDKITVAEIAKEQLALTFAAIHTTTLTATNIIFTLAVTPEYIEPLREEIRNAMADNNGKITTRTLQQLVRMDSYMKEVTRLYSPGITTFSRRVLKGINLSNGQYIPPGVIVETPLQAIFKDPAYYPDSDVFDGFRHYKLRSGGTASDHARNQFVTTNETNLGFGYGRHACPGRFFATNEIKMILSRLILEYDIKMPDGSLNRHKQIELGRSTTPDSRKSLMFKRVEV